MPPALHAHLANMAEQQSVSLNQLIVALLAGGSAFKIGPGDVGASQGQDKRTEGSHVRSKR